jgi:long-subunit fatty acid transport protein
LTRTKGAPDAYGNDTWTTTSSTVRGAFNPGTSSELVQGQDLLTVQPSVYLPTGTAVTAVDAVQVGGQVYEVDGSPNDWANPFTGHAFGVEVRLKRVTG